MAVTFLGMPMSQSWNDFQIWEEFFEKFPIKTFIELGTGNGGMSTYFALQCAQRGISFYTFDHQTWFDFGKKVPQMLGMQAGFQLFDLFSSAGVAAVVSVIQTNPRPLAIFFDNGNKPREWQVFAPFTEPGDFCIVHDWGMEFKQEDIGGVNVERILTELSDLRPAGWKSMWFRRV